ncbi:MAG: hypothetical protein ACK416_04380, partial [Zestosphaera sp.]
MKIDELITRIQKFEVELRKPFVGRDEESRVVVLAFLTGEHAILLGEPGCVTGDTIVSFGDGRLSYIEDVAKDLPPGIYATELPIFPPSK